MEVKLHLFLTSALDVDDSLISFPSCFTQVKQTRYPLNRRLWEAPEQVWALWRSLKSLAVTAI